MVLAVDSIRNLTRAFIGARVYQGLLFWFVLVQNTNAALKDVVDPSPRLQMWFTLGAIVAAATLGTYYRWRFGWVAPPRPSLSRQVVRATAFALVLMAALAASVVVAVPAGGRPIDLMWLLLSAGTATSLAISRGERLGWVVALLAPAGLLVTLVVPALQPYRALGHAGMAAALVLAAVQLHLFLVRGFRHALV
jgi:hypothetical protein